MAKHTSGTWESSAVGVYGASRTLIVADLSKTSATHGPNYPDASETAANARLIAAAPDLLLVCQAVEDWEASTRETHDDVRRKYGIPNDQNVYDWVRGARRAAIAKATT